VESIAEKRFPATPKRRQEARKKGQVLKSQELISAVMLLALVGFLKFWLPHIFNKIADLFRFLASFSGEWNVHSVSEVAVSVAWQSFLILGPLFLLSVAVAVAVNFLQVGALFTVEPLKPQISRLSPVQGLKRMFGLKALVQLLKSLFKVLVIGYFLYAVIRDNMNVFPALQGLTVGQSTVILGNLLFELAWKAALAFLIIAVADFLYQWWEYEKNLRMSQQEIKEEYKQTEGDPQLKAQIKKRQRMFAMRRMMEDLKEADVVITNPTHYAVALKYDPAKHAAPYVVAKGQNELALRIRALAEENGIIIMENRPLAQALYAQVDLGQVVPADLYKAVAEVLAFVYKLNKRKRYYSA
jgi:flagellar biosynthetic protein FlhB